MVTINSKTVSFNLFSVLGILQLLLQDCLCKIQVIDGMTAQEQILFSHVKAVNPFYWVGRFSFDIVLRPYFK